MVTFVRQGFIKSACQISMHKSILFLLFIMGFSTANSFAQVVDTSSLENNFINHAPTVTLTQSELDDYGETQDISGLLQSSRDVFTSTAGYTFGSAHYRMRGFDTENTSVLVSGVVMNDMETGRAFWSSWGGLNDAFRNQEIHTGITPSSLGFGGTGGLTNISTRASGFSKGVKLTYSFTDQSYRNRLMFIASTGKMQNGWSATLSASRRWSQEGYVEGTFYDAWSYFVSLEKELNSSHSIGFIGFAAPNKRGMSGVAIQEANDLAGSNFYNPNWGYQNGEKRNARISQYHQPVLLLSHYWTLSDRAKLTTSLSYAFGRGGSTALNWTEADDPRPDYYRNLPSYLYNTGDIEAGENATDLWLGSKEYRQLNWDALYFANNKFLYTVNDANGIQGNTITGNRSKYIVEDRRNDKSRLGLTSNYVRNVNEHLIVSTGINLTWYKGYHYNVVEDLLGGDFWLDVDKYANEEPNIITDESQSDLRNPNRIVGIGDRYSHDYTATVNNYNLFAQGDFSYARIDFFIAATASYTEFWRTGNMQNGHFPDNSYGDSEKQQFTNGGLKAGLTWKINGKNYLTASTALLTRAPFFWNSFISPRTRNQVVSGLENEKVFGSEASYLLRTNVVKARLTVYYSEFNDQSWSRSFYHEDLNTFVNYMMINVDEVHTGAEFGIEANLTSTFSVSGIVGIGEFFYTSRPDATISRDNDSQVLSNRTVYIKNYYLGGMPQTIASAGIKYNSPDYWWIGANANYYGDIYLEVNPDRRTQDAVSNLTEEDIRLKQLLEQEKLDNGFTIDVFAGKSWKVKNYYFGINLNISNLLNNTDIASGGYEQFRYDPADIDKFPPKYYYLFGRNYYININFRF
jgi:hypothetical protein